MSENSSINFTFSSGLYLVFEVKNCTVKRPVGDNSPANKETDMTEEAVL